MAGRDHSVKIQSVLSGPATPADQMSGVSQLFPHHLITGLQFQIIERGTFLGHPLSVDIKDVVRDPNVISWQTDHPLDEIALVPRREEHHDITPLRLPNRHYLGT